MPKLCCNCGEVIQYGQIPSPNEWLIIDDVAMDKFFGMVDSEEIYRLSKSFLKCPACSRLFVFWHGFQSEPQIFIPEKAKN